LVSKVKEGDKVLNPAQGDDFLPLLGGKVYAGRVMAAGVEQDDASVRHPFKAFDHSAEIKSVGLRVVVGIGSNLEARIFEHPPVVLPGGVTDEDIAARDQPA